MSSSLPNNIDIDFDLPWAIFTIQQNESIFSTGSLSQWCRDNLSGPWVTASWFLNKRIAVIQPEDKILVQMTFDCYHGLTEMEKAFGKVTIINLFAARTAVWAPSLEEI